MKRGILKCRTPAERAGLAAEIRKKRDELGLTAADLRVIVDPAKRFEIQIEAKSDVFDHFFERVRE